MLGLLPAAVEPQCSRAQQAANNFVKLKILLNGGAHQLITLPGLRKALALVSHIDEIPQESARSTTDIEGATVATRSPVCAKQATKCRLCRATEYVGPRVACSNMAPSPPRPPAPSPSPISRHRPLSPGPLGPRRPKRPQAVMVDQFPGDSAQPAYTGAPVPASTSGRCVRPCGHLRHHW